MNRRAIIAGIGLGAFRTESDAQELVPWWQTAQLEHIDRRDRFGRIAAQLGLDIKPEFSSYIVPRSRLPAAFPIDLPVLRVIFPEKAFFETAQANLKSDAMPIIRLVAEALRREPPDVAMFVAGHTDARGGEVYNYNLSVRRAEAVAETLATIGVGQVVLWRVGFGKSVPRYPNTVEPFLGYNRRVEFLFAAKTQAVAAWLADQLDTVCVGATPAQMTLCRKDSVVAHDFEAVRVRAPAPARPIAAPTYAKNKVAPVEGRQKIATAAPEKIRIDLNLHKYAIAAPNAF